MEVTLTADERSQWEAAVATWPTCQTCGGNCIVYHETRNVPIECPDCVAGRVPQPVYIVIEGEPSGRGRGSKTGIEQFKPTFQPDGTFVVPARWRVPVGRLSPPCARHAQAGMTESCICPGVGEPCEIRAECPACSARGTFCSGLCHGRGWVLLAPAATVEVLPVYDTDHRGPEQHAVVVAPSGVFRLDRNSSQPDYELTLDPLVPGRHFVAVVTP